MTPHNVLDGITAIRQAADATALHQAMTRTASAMGFEYWCLVQQANDGIAFDEIQYNNYPSQWVARLSRDYFYIHDPVLKACHDRSVPFWWDELEDLIEMNGQQRAYMAMAAEMGIRSGLTVPWHLPGEPSALMSLASSLQVPRAVEIGQAANFVACWGMERARRIRDAGSSSSTRRMSEPAATIVRMMTRGLSPGSIAVHLEMPRDEVVAVINGLRKEYRTSSDIEVVVRGIHNGRLKTTELPW